MSHASPSSGPERTALEPLLDIADTAKFLRISSRQVHRLLARGELVGVRVGSRLRFTPEELRAYVSRESP